jgi:hypothetical protein
MIVSILAGRDRRLCWQEKAAFRVVATSRGAVLQLAFFAPSHGRYDTATTNVCATPVHALWK